MPVDSCSQWAVPAHVGPTIFTVWNTRQKRLSANGRLVQAKLDQTAAESNQIAVTFLSFPVDPGDFVILTVGVVVSVLSAAELVASNQHRNTLA